MTKLIAFLGGWKGYAALGVAAAVAGWTVNGWRFERAQLRKENSAYAAMIDRHDENFEELKALAKSGAAMDAQAAAAAKEGKDALERYIAENDTCRLSGDDARILRNNARRRAEARH